MRIALHHREALVPRQVHNLVQRYPLLDEPRGEGVPQVVKAKIIQPRPLACLLERRADIFHGLATIGENGTRLFRPQFRQHAQCPVR